MLSEKAIEGYAYQESITGEAVKDIQARRLEEIGITFYHDKQRAKLQGLVKQVEADPDAYTQIIETKTAEIEAAKPPVVEPVIEEVK